MLRGPQNLKLDAPFIRTYEEASHELGYIVHIGADPLSFRRNNHLAGVPCHIVSDMQMLEARVMSQEWTIYGPSLRLIFKSSTKVVAIHICCRINARYVGFVGCMRQIGQKGDASHIFCGPPGPVGSCHYMAMKSSCTSQILRLPASKLS